MTNYRSLSVSKQQPAASQQVPSRNGTTLSRGSIPTVAANQAVSTVMGPPSESLPVMQPPRLLGSPELPWTLLPAKSLSAPRGRMKPVSGADPVVRRSAGETKNGTWTCPDIAPLRYNQAVWKIGFHWRPPGKLMIEDISDGQEQEKSGNRTPRLRRDWRLQLYRSPKTGERETRGQEIQSQVAAAHRAQGKEKIR